MKKKHCTLFLLLLLAVPVTQAQVTIGTNVDKPNEFSVLELITESAKGGLRMPQLTDEQRNTLTQSDAFVAEMTGKALGLTIFNTSTKCLEYWNGEEWVSRCSDTSCPPQEMPGIITLSATGPLKLNDEFTVGVPEISGEPGITYHWTIPPTLAFVGQSTDNPVRLKALISGKHGLYNIGVTATNACGNTSSCRAGTGFLEVLNCEKAPEQSDIDLTLIKSTNLTLITGGNLYEIISGYTFTLYYDAPSSVNTISYNWSLSDVGNKFFTIISEGNGSITLRANPDREGETCEASAIGIIASNECGAAPFINSGLQIKIIPEPGPCEEPAKPGDIDFSTTDMVVTRTFTASVPEVSGTTYTWTVPAGFNIEGEKTAHEITIRATTVTSVNLSAFGVTATNDCGRTSEMKHGSGGNLSVKEPSIILPGTGNIIGQTCFDIASGNDDSGGCGPLADRAEHKTVFADGNLQDPAVDEINGTYTGLQVYTYIPVDPSKVSDVIFAIEDTNNPRVINSFTQNGNKLTVQFNPDLDQILAAHGQGLPDYDRSSALKANIFVIYKNENNEERRLTMPLTFQDCACCGAKVSATKWLNFMCHNLGGKQDIDPFNYSKDIIGDHYQWGRWADSHEVRSDKEFMGIARTANLNEVGQVKTESMVGVFINSKNTSDNSLDWRTPGDDNLWRDDKKAIGDPCPPGWKVPSRQQLEDILVHNGTPQLVRDGTKVRGVRIGNLLFLPITYTRTLHYNPGPNPSSDPINGEYWTSTSSNSGSPRTSFSLIVSNDGVKIDLGGTTYRGQGRAVRCVQETK